MSRLVRTTPLLLVLGLGLGVVAASPATTEEPNAEATEQPTAEPTETPTEEPTETPTEEPTEPERLQPCTNPQGLEVLTLDGLDTTIEAPTTPVWGLGISADSARQKDLILDLAGQLVDEDSASITVVMTWDIPVEDYDLNLYDGTGTEVDHSENVQPIDGDSETVSGTMTHCEEFQVESLNWTAAGASTLSLDISAIQF